MSEAGTAAQNAAVPALRQAAQVCPAARRTFGIGDTAVLTILLGCFLFELYIVKKNICRAVKKIALEALFYHEKYAGYDFS